jgi:hypothetical protein
MTSTQKVAIVTGAGSGIGKASALALMKVGYAVAFAGMGAATSMVPATITGPSALGRMWRTTWRSAGAPRLLGGLDEFLLAQRQELGAHQARHPTSRSRTTAVSPKPIQFVSSFARRGEHGHCLRTERVG